MTRPTLGEMRQGAIVRTADDEEMIIVNPTEGEVLRLGHCFVSYENPRMTITHLKNDLDLWKELSA